MLNNVFKQVIHCDYHIILISANQDKENKIFKESKKRAIKELKSMKGDKDVSRRRREEFEVKQQEEEREFLSRLRSTLEAEIQKMTQGHRSQVAHLEHKFLQEKHNKMRGKSPNWVIVIWVQWYVQRDGSREGDLRSQVKGCSPRTQIPAREAQ